MLDWLIDSWPGLIIVTVVAVVVFWVGEKLRGSDGREDIEQM